MVVGGNGSKPNGDAGFQEDGSRTEKMQEEEGS